jgi:hypothetical protein
MPFANLPDTHKSRWGDELTAEKMKECVWLRPEAVAQIEFLEWTGADRLRHSKYGGLSTVASPLAHRVPKRRKERMSLEGWKTFFEVGGVTLLFLTFVFGAGALFTSTRINARQAEELRQFDKKLTDAQTELGKQQERAATAERALLQLKERVKDRTISPDQRAKLIELLTGKVGGPVEILWMTSDSDSYPLALQIKDILKAAGWPDAVERMALSGTGVGHGITVRSIKTPPKYAIVLQQAFGSVGFVLEGSEETTLPENTVRIWIGHKPNTP